MDAYEPTTEDIQAYNDEDQKRMEVAQIFEHSWHIPERPYSPIDEERRHWDLQAILEQPVTLTITDILSRLLGMTIEGTIITQYYYGERVVLARGSFVECLTAAIREYKRGHLGSAVSVGIKDDDFEALEVCRSSSNLAPGKLNSADRSWYTWRHKCAAASARDSANPYGLRMNFDWDLLQVAQDEEAYEKALTEKFGRAWTF